MSPQSILSVFNADLFKGKRVVVSGATSGIGLEMARGFAALGAEVVATGTSHEKMAALENDERGRKIRLEKLDVRDGAAVRAFAAGFNSLNVLVNAAGIGRDVAEFEEATFMDVVDVNLNGMMRLATAFHAQLRAAQGAVINLASMLSFLTEPNVPGYTASKTGVVGLTRGLAHAWGREGIRVNAIAPGYHKTAMTEPLWSVPKSHDLIAERSALKRWGTTEDLVGTAIFLASPAAAFITAAALPVDGGYVVGNTVC